MLIALLTDIHANLEAFEACLEQARRAGATRHVILGDIVGYGADPSACIDLCRRLAETGAIIVRGNHDQAIGDPSQSMNGVARTAIDWTREQLSKDERDWLAGLPLTHEEDDRLYVHAEGSAPARFNYVTDAEAARRHLSAVAARVSFCGHVHRAALYGHSDATGKTSAFTPNSAGPVPLMSQRRWLAVIGAVGQSRDGNPMASYALYDTKSRELRFLRTAYDIRAAQMKIWASGLPDALAERLEKGR